MRHKIQTSYSLSKETIEMIKALRILQGRNFTNVIENAIKNEYRREIDAKENDNTR